MADDPYKILKNDQAACAVNAIAEVRGLGALDYKGVGAAFAISGGITSTTHIFASTAKPNELIRAEVNINAPPSHNDYDVRTFRLEQSPRIQDQTLEVSGLNNEPGSISFYKQTLTGLQRNTLTEDGKGLDQASDEQKKVRDKLKTCVPQTT
jgi:hypothetical protein